MNKSKTALVLGATGGIGSELAYALLARGWSVNALVRDAHRAKKSSDPRIKLIEGDAMREADVIGAAQSASVIAHCVNPPGYKNWEKLVVPMIENSITAARASGARIVLPGTIYNFGLDAFPLISVASPQNPISRKGAIRVKLEQRLERAANDGIPVLIVRAGDFFGGKAGGNTWFAQGFVKPGKPLSSIQNPNSPNVAHSWAYLPDLAETMAELIERGPKRSFERFHFEGYHDATGDGMIEAIKDAAGNPSIPVRPFPWWLITLGSPFVPVFSEIREMRYLWNNGHQLDNKELIDTLGHEPRTPIAAAVRETLTHLGCI
jgi:nucleoside-diphosphate-sugar epimerase